MNQPTPQILNIKERELELAMTRLFYEYGFEGMRLAVERAQKRVAEKHPRMVADQGWIV